MTLPRNFRSPQGTSQGPPYSGPDAAFPRHSYPLPERQVQLDPAKFTYVDITHVHPSMLDVRAKHYLKKLEYIPRPQSGERFQQVMLPVKEVRKGSPYVEAIWGLVDTRPAEGGPPRLLAAINWSTGGGAGYPALPGMSMEEMWDKAKKNNAARDALNQPIVNAFKINYTSDGTEGFSRTRDKAHWNILFNGRNDGSFSLGIHPVNFADGRNSFRIHGSGRSGDGDDAVRGTWGCMTCTANGMKVFFDAHLAALKAGNSGAFVPPGTQNVRQGIDALYANRGRLAGLVNNTVPIFNPLVINERSPNYVAVKGQAAGNAVTTMAAGQTHDSNPWKNGFVSKTPWVHTTQAPHQTPPKNWWQKPHSAV